MIELLVSSMSMVFEHVDETRVRIKEYVKIERCMMVTNVTRDLSVESRLTASWLEMIRTRDRSGNCAIWNTIWIYSSWKLHYVLF